MPKKQIHACAATVQDVQEQRPPADPIVVQPGPSRTQKNSVLSFMHKMAKVDAQLTTSTSTLKNEFNEYVLSVAVDCEVNVTEYWMNKVLKFGAKIISQLNNTSSPVEFPGELSQSSEVGARIIC